MRLRPRRKGHEIIGKLWRWARVAVGAGILAFLVTQLGLAPFADALGSISGGALAAAFAISVLTTLCSAWRWSIVAGGLGVTVRLRAAVGACYRSQFLNSTLPGGVLGDVHRGVRHGREAGALARCLRAVAWERSLGQVVQLSLTALVVVLLASSLPPLDLLPVSRVLVALAAVAAAAALARILWPRRPRSGAVARVLSTIAGDLSGVARQPWALTRIALASTVVVAGHTTIFIIAARSSGVSVPLDRLLPVVLIVLMVSAVPTNIAGWGPREGAAAWAFGIAGLSAAQGVTTAVVYGVLSLVATLPGLLVLVAARPVPRSVSDRHVVSDTSPRVMEPVHA